MTTTIKVLGLLGMMMTACSTVSVASYTHDEYMSDPEGYARGVREGFEDRKLNLPSGANSNRKIRQYTVEQLLAIRSTVEPDSALEQEAQTALAGTGLRKNASAIEEPAESEVKG